MGSARREGEEVRRDGKGGKVLLVLLLSSTINIYNKWK